MAEVFTQYRKKQLAEMRPYVPGESMAGIPINDEARAHGSPKIGDFIARDAANPADQWLVTAQFAADNYEPV
jgi:hypothetical protein